jgi:putative peptidoglycan lipid II flippase
MSVLTFVYSIAAVYFPRFAVLWDAKNINGFQKALVDVMNTLIFLLLPMTFGFMAIRYSMFNLLSYHGRVTADDVLMSGNLLALYSIGIWALGFKEVFDRAFYAQKNAKISGIVGIVIMVLNIVLSLLLIPYLGVYSLPLSFSISASAGSAILIYIMRKKLKFFSGKTWELTFKCLLSSITMFALLSWFSPIFEGFFGNSIIERAIKLFIPITLGVITYFALTAIMGVEQSKTFLNAGRRIVKKITAGKA